MSDVILDIDGAAVTVSADDPRAIAAAQIQAEPDPIPPVPGDAIIGAIAKADRSKVDPTDFARIAWRDDVPVTNAKLSRIAKALGTTPDALRQASISTI